MKALVMTLAMSLAILTLGHPSQAAQFISNRTIAELRRMMTTENEWVNYASGVGAALGALDGWCTQPVSVGETAAYLRFTAAEWKSAAQAIKEYWHSRNCHTLAEIDWILKSPVLLAACTTTDPDYLRSLIESSDKDNMTELARIVATHRLQELGQMPKVPPQAR